ncbi:MAG TPA: ABC transporter permease [Candidatus Sulfomarinibacteraceae bacterium]|nr:ABC transporter permease [Candidatus Sulfomarinibacteraceae bacterium]
MSSLPEQRRRSREGSPWTGLWAVVFKDMADHLTSARMRILELLILATAGGTIFVAVQNLRENASPDDPFIYLRLFTTSQEPLPAFIGFLGFLVPLIAIALAFDAVNGEFNQRTLSRVLAQPIYRDALLAGKFLAALLTMALVLSAIWLLIIGMGLLGLGVAPGGEEMARILLFLLATIFYGGIWLALAMVFSTVFRQSATAALASIAVWLFFIIFWDILARIVAQAARPVQVGTVQELFSQAQLVQALSRLSPNVLFVEATVGLLNPATRSFGLVLPSQYQGAILGAPLPLGESLMLVWPHLTGMIAATILLFAVSYVMFQRQEIRA